MSHTKLDCHADTIVTRSKFAVVCYTDRMCDVYPYYNAYDPVKGVPVVHEATGCTTKTGDNFILILNKALWMPNLG